jgi:hypothetical protein
VDKKGHLAKLNTGTIFSVTSGFAFLCMYLHPLHQPGSRFRYLGREASERGDYVITFAQKSEISDYLIVFFDSLYGLLTPYLLQGFVWLHPESYQVMRMETRMTAPAGQLQEQSTKVDYREVTFEGVPHPFWLPGEVTVNLKVRGVLYRNRHQYSDYRLFNVESDYKIALPKMSSPKSPKPGR